MFYLILAQVKKIIKEFEKDRKPKKRKIKKKQTQLKKDIDNKNNLNKSPKKKND